MRTIFVTSFHVLISRNILATDCFRRLLDDPDNRIVLFVPDYKQAYFAAAFGGARTTVVGVSIAFGRFDRIMRQFALLALDSRSMAIKRHWELLPERRYGLFALKTVCAFLLGGNALATRLLRWIDVRFGPVQRFEKHFERQRPDLLFVTDVMNELDGECMRLAKRMGIFTIGMVRSWDNLTAKGLLRSLPDQLIVHNDLLRDEAASYHRVPTERIAVTGIPHYDAYRAYRPVARAEFMRSLGLDPRGRLALVAPTGDRYIRRNVTDRTVLEALVSGRASGALPPNLQALVRLPPTDVVNLEGFIPPSWMKIERPGVSFRPGAVKEAELSPDDDKRLFDSLSSADVLITGRHLARTLRAGCALARRDRSPVA